MTGIDDLGTVYPGRLSRRTILRMIAASAATLALPRMGWVQPDNPRQPNFVFILADDLGWRDVAFMGSRYYETPHADRLAREGVIFTHAYANAPNCAPTRACLMSGQYTPRHGIYTVGSSERGQSQNRKLIPIPNTTALSPDTITLAEMMKRGGYATAHIGKWHLGDEGKTGPLAQGFDERYGANWGGYRGHYFSQAEEGKQEGRYLTDLLTDDAIRFIENNRKHPFFLNLWHHGVHVPHEAIQGKIEKYKQKQGTPEHFDPTYAAMIESLDESIGRVLAKLDELNLAENTVVVFFSDNGGYGPITSMKPLRGAKGMLYEGGIRVPCAVRWPGKIQAGSVCENPVIGLDFYPTILSLAGIENDSGQILDGEDLTPLLMQTDSLKRNALFWHFPVYLEAYRDSVGPWRTTPVGAIREGDYKLIEFFEDGRLELYDLRDDIGESNNLVSSMPEKTQQLHRKLADWRKSVRAPVPSERNPDYKVD